MKYLKKISTAIASICIICLMSSCTKAETSLEYENPDAKIIFLHHSTGRNVWYGDLERGKRFYTGESMCMVPRLIKEYNDANNKKISIEELAFPSGNEYPWKNYPYDYYNIWVKNAGDTPYKGEPTLEILAKEYDIIIFKHCYPISYVVEDDSVADINSDKKTLANYKLQYNAVKEKMLEFPETKFLVWTGAALVEAKTTEEQASRYEEFNQWVKNEWSTPGDNIEIFDFRILETGDGLYLKSEFAVGEKDSHPNMEFSALAAKEFSKRIIEVIEK